MSRNPEVGRQSNNGYQDEEPVVTVNVVRVSGGADKHIVGSIPCEEVRNQQCNINCEHSLHMINRTLGSARGRFMADWLQRLVRRFLLRNFNKSKEGVINCIFILKYLSDFWFKDDNIG